MPSPNDQNQWQAPLAPPGGCTHPGQSLRRLDDEKSFTTGPDPERYRCPTQMSPLRPETEARYELKRNLNNRTDGVGRIDCSDALFAMPLP